MYDTICAAQMTLKSNYAFRKLADSGLKKLAEELCHERLPTFSDVTNGRHFDELDAQDAETIRYGCADSDFALRLYHIFMYPFLGYLRAKSRLAAVALRNTPAGVVPRTPFTRKGYAASVKRQSR